MHGHACRKGRPTFCSGPTFCNRRNGARNAGRCGPQLRPGFREMRLTIAVVGKALRTAFRGSIADCNEGRITARISGRISPGRCGSVFWPQCGPHFPKTRPKCGPHFGLGGSAATGPQKERRCALPRPRPRKSKRAVPAYSARRATLLRRPFEPRAPPACIPRGRCADVSLPDPRT